MSPVHFYNPAALFLLLLVPGLALLFVRAAEKRKRAAVAFGAESAIVGRKREAVGGCLALLLAGLALSRPAWTPEETSLQQSGRDVVFLLDVSRSMLAEDLYPNRLENAKIAILDCVEMLAGDRVGLVLFAGSAEIRCPMTADYEYFRMALRQAAPDSVAAGGTMIANALEKTVDKLIDPEKPGLQDVVIITDGEDMGEGADEIDAARKLADAGARLIAIGIGDRIRGGRIALEESATGGRTFLKHENREVWTKLHSDLLRGMAAAVPDGIYVEVADGPFDLRQIYRQIMKDVAQSPTDRDTMERYRERFPLFLAGSILVLLLTHRWNTRSVRFMLGLMFVAGTASAGPEKLFREGNKAYQEGRYEDAIAMFETAAGEQGGSAEILYNLGAAQFRLASYDEAAASFGMAASLASNEGLRSRCWYNLANCMVKTAESLREGTPEEAYDFCQQAVAVYRQAFVVNPELADAAYNLEICQRLAAAIVADIRQQQEQQQQQNDLIQHVHEKLKEFIARQQNLIQEQVVGETQQQLEGEVRELADLIAASGLQADIPLPDGTLLPAPLKETYAHTCLAADAMVVPDQPVALAELVAALDSVPAAPDNQGESEGDEGDSDDASMDYEQTDQDADMYDEANPFGDFSEYEEIRGVPPPNRTEKDILAEELRNQERRKQSGAGEYKAGEKDW